MDLNSIAIGALLFSGSGSSSDRHLIDKYSVETMDGIKFTVQADKCSLYYNETTLGCYKNREWVLVAPWDKIKHFKQLEGE